MDNIKVSIICNAFNHEKYIAKTMDSFLMQQTNFDYEILIHDDASTDRTAEIIRDYEKRFPNKIKAILQKENQYSKGVDISRTIQCPRARGKYIAICEGDDYWISTNKLQRQFDLMETHPELNMSAHATRLIDFETQKQIGDMNKGTTVKVLSQQQIIKGGGGFLATCSLFFRKELNDVIPSFRLYFPLDYSLQIHGSLKGGILYIPDIEAVHYKNIKNSWTYNMQRDANARIKVYRKEIKMLSLLDQDTKHAYSFSIYQKKIELFTKILYSRFRSIVGK